MAASLFDKWQDACDAFESANDDCVNNTIMRPAAKCVEGHWQWIWEEDAAMMRSGKKCCGEKKTWLGWLKGWFSSGG